jgi:subtilisin family serine protease
MSPASVLLAYVLATGEPLPTLPAIVVVLAPGVSPPAELQRHGEPLGGPSWRLPSAHPLADALAWRARPGVRAADPDLILPRVRRQFDDPEYGGQWYLEDLGYAELLEVSLGDPATHAAVIDSGIEIAHPDLADAILDPYDAVDEDQDPSPNLDEFCPVGGSGICDEHGTAVSGVVAARGNNGVGIVGLCPTCSLVPIKMLAEGGSPVSSDIRAFEHAILADSAVINNSWGFDRSLPVPETLAEVIGRAATEPRGGLGAVVVFAAGNDDRELYDDEVTGLPEVLCVSAVDSYGHPTAYTNFGASVDVAAPSATVTLSVEGGTTREFGGTSAAAPVVSGMVAWGLSVRPDLSAAEMIEIVVDTARPSPLVTPDENGHHDVYGYGIIDAHAFLERLIPPEAGEDAGPPDAGPAAQDGGLDGGAGDGDADADGPDEGSGGGCGCRFAAGLEGQDLRRKASAPGQISGPGGLGLLALGAFGAHRLARRRRR